MNRRQSGSIVTPSTLRVQRIARQAALALAAAALLPSELPAQGPPAALVITSPVPSEAITDEVDFLGTVRPVLDSLVASEIEGRVAQRLVENGDQVRRGQHLVILDSTRLATELERAEADLAETEARLVLARKQEDRARELHDSAVLASGSYDERVAERRALEGRRASIEARIASLSYDLDLATIKAPFSGTITEIHCEVGEWVGRGAPAVRMTDLGTIEIRLEVPERYYTNLKPGSHTPVTLDALPGLALDATIFSLVPQANEEARTFPVIIRAANSGRKVSGGMLARVRLAVSTGREALLVPKDAIVRQAQQSVIYVVNGDETVRAVGVSTRRADGTRVEISGDVKAGEHVVIKGNERLQPGQKVRSEVGAAVAPAGR
jgi:RND family efflux transporter MFP subunit